MPLNRATRPKRLRALLGCTLLAFAAALGVLSLQTGFSHASGGSRGALATVGGSRGALATVGGSRGATATVEPTWAGTAGVETINELMRMRITSVKGKKVSARGSSSGTINGSVSFYLILSSASRASAEFFGSNSNGTVSGKGTASYRVAGSISYFNGTVTSVSGSRRYRHSYSLGIEFSGTVNRRTYEVTMRLRGKWHV